MSKKEKLADEVRLAWEVMTCLGLRTTYDRPDSPCHWFSEQYGPYPAFSPVNADSDGIGRLNGVLRTDRRSTFRARSKGKRFNVPEILSGCRKAPIMSIGINPNLTSYQYGINGSTWCYPYFEDLSAYAKHFRYRTVNQERFVLDFIRDHLDPKTCTTARADGKITGMTFQNDVLSLSIHYTDGFAETLRLPADRMLMFDTRDPYPGDAPRNAFKKGDIIAGKSIIPEDAETDIIREPVGYYRRFQKMIETFKQLGDERLRASDVRLGEDACMGDMVSCASPGWNAYFPDEVREGVISECVHRRRHFSRQVIQSRPAVIVFSGQASFQMFADVFPCETAPTVDARLSVYELLTACVETPYLLEFSDGDVRFTSRIVFSPHFSYPDSFDAGCRFSTEAWADFEKQHPQDAALLGRKKRSVYSGVFVDVNPDKAPYNTELSAEGKAAIELRYIDPIDAVAKVMLQEYDGNRLSLDADGKHLLRTDGPCRFCNNELFEIEQGCLYDK